MKLIAGKGSPKTGACWMSAIAWYAGYKWTDQPECVDPVIRALCIALNDRLPDNATRERVIGPHLMTPLGTNQGNELSIARAFVCADRAVRVFAPKALVVAGLQSAAASLRTRPPIVDRETALAGQAAARCATSAAAAATTVTAAAAAATAAYAAYAATYATYATTAATAAYAAYAATAANILQLILDLCAMGEKCEVPQLRDVALLPQ